MIARERMWQCGSANLRDEGKHVHLTLSNELTQHPFCQVAFRGKSHGGEMAQAGASSERSTSFACRPNAKCQLIVARPFVIYFSVL